MERDAWLDLVLGLDAIPDDGPELPRGCTPYFPCSVEAVLPMVERAGVSPSDVFVDVGSGLGRVAVLVHLLTGAAAIGLEIQPELVLAARELTTRLQLSRISFIQGDAVNLAGLVTTGSVFFLYCPFSGARLEKVLDALELIARTRQIRICCVDLPLPARAWLELESSSPDVCIHRSTSSVDQHTSRFELGEPGRL
jgi:SAM-dependent methyltransferase